MARPRLVLDELLISRMYLQGLSFSEIGKELGVHGGTIRNRLVDLGYSTRRIHTPHNKGKSWTPEERAKHLSTRRTRAYREAVSERQRGEKSNLWRGGVSKNSRSPRGWEWNERRKECYTRDNWTCQKCGVRCVNRKGEVRRRIQAHHMIPRRLGGTDDLGNLQTLCAKCHGATEGLSVHRRK